MEDTIDHHWTLKCSHYSYCIVDLWYSHCPTNVCMGWIATYSCSITLHRMDHSDTIKATFLIHFLSHVLEKVRTCTGKCIGNIALYSQVKASSRKLDVSCTRKFSFPSLEKSLKGTGRAKHEDMGNIPGDWRLTELSKQRHSMACNYWWPVWANLCCIALPMQPLHANHAAFHGYWSGQWIQICWLCQSIAETLPLNDG